MFSCVKQTRTTEAIIVALEDFIFVPIKRTNYRGADVDWYIKADDIVLKNKGNQPAGNQQNHSPQGQPKK